MSVAEKNSLVEKITDVVIIAKPRPTIEQIFEAAVSQYSNTLTLLAKEN
jgi:hypothetical protein